jgi:hypothetical protein
MSIAIAGFVGLLVLAFVAAKRRKRPRARMSRGDVALDVRRFKVDR